jgi:hypothetical protein
MDKNFTIFNSFCLIYIVYNNSNFAVIVGKFEFLKFFVRGQETWENSVPPARQLAHNQKP